VKMAWVILNGIALATTMSNGSKGHLPSLRQKMANEDVTVPTCDQGCNKLLNISSVGVIDSFDALFCRWCLHSQLPHSERVASGTQDLHTSVQVYARWSAACQHLGTTTS
ncbi:hypothetical protein Tco_0864081, partial [Tanacetum coccineum]